MLSGTECHAWVDDDRAGRVVLPRKPRRRNDQGAEIVGVKADLPLLSPIDGWRRLRFDMRVRAGREHGTRDGVSNGVAGRELCEKLLA